MAAERIKLRITDCTCHFETRRAVVGNLRSQLTFLDIDYKVGFGIFGTYLHGNIQILGNSGDFHIYNVLVAAHKLAVDPYGHDIGICYGCNLERERHTAHNLGGCTADCGTLYLLWHGYGVVNHTVAYGGDIIGHIIVNTLYEPPYLLVGRCGHADKVAFTNRSFLNLAGE